MGLERAALELGFSGSVGARLGLADPVEDGARVQDQEAGVVLAQLENRGALARGRELGRGSLRRGELSAVYSRSGLVGDGARDVPVRGAQCAMFTAVSCCSGGRNR